MAVRSHYRGPLAADLVLLDAIPLARITNIMRVSAVAVGGRWIPTAECERMIRAAMTRLSGGE